MVLSRPSFWRAALRLPAVSPLALAGVVVALLWVAAPARARESRPAADAVTLIHLHGELSRSETAYYVDAVNAARARGDAALVLDIASVDAYQPLEPVFPLLEALARFPGETVAYAKSRALGPHAAAVLAAKSVYLSPGALVGRIGLKDEAAEGGYAELPNFERASVRAVVADVPFRLEVARAMTERNNQLTVPGGFTKPKGEFLILTGRESAKAVRADAELVIGDLSPGSNPSASPVSAGEGASPASKPLLATALAPDLEAALRLAFVLPDGDEAQAWLDGLRRVPAFADRAEAAPTKADGAQAAATEETGKRSEADSRPEPGNRAEAASPGVTADAGDGGGDTRDGGAETTGTDREETRSAGQTADARPGAADAPDADAPALRSTGQRPLVYVLPIEGVFDTTQEIIARRAIKDAIRADADVIVVKLDTPGGMAGVMLDIMDGLIEQYDGRTIAYVNDEATSAGAILACVCDDIYFSPLATMGSAELVSGSGAEIDPRMRAKIEAFLDAKLRVAGKGNRYRFEVYQAMSRIDYELKIDGELLKTEGELLNLTADEAVREFGDPPSPLLANGIYEDLDALLDGEFGRGNYEVREFKLSWSEDFAKWFGGIAPILLGLGVLLLFVELNTPQFGLIGFAGLILIGIVFASQYFAGMAGYEPVLVFVAGLVLVLIELFLTPGIGVLMLIGALTILVSLLWALADVWPSPDGGLPTVRGDSLWEALKDLIIAMTIALVGIVAAWRYLPKGSAFRGLVLETVSKGHSGGVNPGGRLDREVGSLEPGAAGRVSRALHPGGEIEVGGKRYPARAEHGSIDAGAPVEVVRRTSFEYVVRPRD